MILDGGMHAVPDNDVLQSDGARNQDLARFGNESRWRQALEGNDGKETQSTTRATYLHLKRAERGYRRNYNAYRWNRRTKTASSARLTTDMARNAQHGTSIPRSPGWSSIHFSVLGLTYPEHTLRYHRRDPVASPRMNQMIALLFLLLFNIPVAQWRPSLLP
ncbi:uncharacterized protein EV420DRAFT_1486379 [Desarmillaria tabescens]|uniref:Uncharacterized protein n=1 Tax=Armillaria tabescens TaxID=1929756 RepID=A0AA39JAY2_ARMTA|nr:uncharacterized protein EV420DRAFT_1486379 [Desarmillaria tabescens]KAK0439283.1 hypothetical protein EV420DRAFT_1486379 [Desarmillaria tabescens]